MTCLKNCICTKRRYFVPVAWIVLIFFLKTVSCVSIYPYIIIYIYIYKYIYIYMYMFLYTYNIYTLYKFIYIYRHIYIIIIVIVKVWTETAKLWHKYLISKIRLLRSSYLNVFFTTRSFKYTRQIYVHTFIAALNINFYANTYIYIYIYIYIVI